jgi:hypothetical protein
MPQDGRKNNRSEPRDLGDNPVCSVSFNESVPCIAVVWKGYATSEQLRLAHETIIALLTKHRVSKVLGDDTALPTIHADDRRWIVENWMPRAKAAGLKAIANKSPASYFGKLAIDHVRAVAPSDLVFRSFGDVDCAREWLRAHP